MYDYFAEDPRKGHMWILDPFSVEPNKNDIALPTHLESQLLEISSGSTLKAAVGQTGPGLFLDFWKTVRRPCTEGFEMSSYIHNYIPV